MRNFGFWVANTRSAAGPVQVEAVRDPVLAQVTNRNYRSFDLEYSDQERLKVFLAEMAEWERLV